MRKHEQDIEQSDSIHPVEAVNITTIVNLTEGF